MGGSARGPATPPRRSEAERSAHLHEPRLKDLRRQEKPGRPVVERAHDFDRVRVQHVEDIDLRVHARTPELQPLANPQFNRDRAKVIASIFSSRMKAMSSKEFQDLLRPAFQEDEWIVIVLGGVLGALAGWIQLMTGFTH